MIKNIQSEMEAFELFPIRRISTASHEEPNSATECLEEVPVIS